MTRSRSLRPSSRSLRPRKPKASADLEPIFRMYGRPAPGLLEALLEKADRELTDDDAKRTTNDLIEAACKVYVAAYEAYGKLMPPARARLKGFSPQLLSLAADRADQLERAHATHERTSLSRTQAETRLRAIVASNQALYAQGRRVVAMVRGDDPEAEGQEDAGAAPVTSFEIAQGLERLSIHGRALVRSGDPNVRGRALLYGLDDAYCGALSAAGAEMMELDQKVGDISELSAARQEVELGRAVTLLLVRTILEAFAAARAVDPTMPALPAIFATFARAPVPVKAAPIEARGVPTQPAPRPDPTLRLREAEPKSVRPLPLGQQRAVLKRA
jgi:hypothetical protein